MITDQVKTVLRVMNLTSGFDMVWCASIMYEVGPVNRERFGMTQEIRYYLVPDDSPLLSQEGIITA